jgi:hypothetical protein
MKLRALSFALAILCTTSAFAQTKPKPGSCYVGDILLNGDASRMTIDSTGVASLPCRLDFAPLMGGNTRGRENLLDVGAGEKLSSLNFDVSKLPNVVLQLDGVATRQLTVNPVFAFHKSSIFSMELAPDKTGENDLRVALIDKNNRFGLEVSVWNRFSRTSKVIGMTGVGRSNSFNLQLLKNRNVPGLKLLLTSERYTAQFSIDAELGARGMNGWHYGLLNDDSADNAVPYTWLMGDGPAPIIAVQ